MDCDVAADSRDFRTKIIFMLIDKAANNMPIIKEILYLRWNECHLRAYFKTLTSQLLVSE